MTRIARDGETAVIKGVEFQRATLICVVDGDTLMVNRGRSRDEKVRLLGINTPESVAAQEWRNSEEGKDASTIAKRILTEYAPVYLSCDQGEADKYGRLLRYVWTRLPEDPFDAEEVLEKMLNARLVFEGYAESHDYGDDAQYREYFDALMDDAIANGRGVSALWRPSGRE